MRETPETDAWSWYQQFSHPPTARSDRTSKAFFNRVTADEVSRFNSEFGHVLPEAYETFLLQVGCGYMKQDINGKISDTFSNLFLSPSEIGLFLRGEGDDLEGDSDFVAPNEVPFFRADADTVFVFKASQDAVYFPWGVRKYANSFIEFILKLRADCNFYTEVW